MGREEEEEEEDGMRELEEEGSMVERSDELEGREFWRLEGLERTNGD